MKFWETVGEDIEYTGKQLDRDIVNPSQFRTIINVFRENLPAMFPDRFDKDGLFEFQRP